MEGTKIKECMPSFFMILPALMHNHTAGFSLLLLRNYHLLFLISPPNIILEYAGVNPEPACFVLLAC